MFGRTKALHSVWPIKPNKIAFVRPNMMEQRSSVRSCLTEWEAEAEGGGAGLISASGKEIGAEKCQEMADAGKWKGTGKEEGDRGGAEEGGVGEGGGDRKGRGGDEDGAGEEGC